MEIIQGVVSSVADYSEQGTIYAKFPKLGEGLHPVKYTSPYYKVNGGGFLAIPEQEDVILAWWNPKPRYGEYKLYYISTVVTAGDTPAEDENPKFNTIPKDGSPYNKKAKPVQQSFTNPVGAGFAIRREYSNTKINNSVSMNSETNDVVSVSPLGVQINNSEGDHIVLTSNEGTNEYSGRCLIAETRGSQEFRSISGQIKLKLINGGDINITNDSWGWGAIPPFFGNIRIKSKWRDVSIVADSVAPYGGKIHLVTALAKITLDSMTGAIKIFSGGVPTGGVLPSISIDTGGDVAINALGQIDMNAAGPININSQSVAKVASTAGTIMESAGLVSTNAATHTINGMPLYTMNPTGGDISIVQAVQPLPQPPIGAPVPLPPLPNNYFDGTGAGTA